MWLLQQVNNLKFGNSDSTWVSANLVASFFLKCLQSKFVNSQHCSISLSVRFLKGQINDGWSLHFWLSGWRRALPLILGEICPSHLSLCKSQHYFVSDCYLCGRVFGWQQREFPLVAVGKRMLPWSTSLSLISRQHVSLKLSRVYMSRRLFTLSFWLVQFEHIKARFLLSSSHK